MASGDPGKRKDLREARLREEGDATAAERRQRMLKLGAAAVFAAIVIVAAAILISQSGSDEGGDASTIAGAAEINGQLEGIPQRGLVIGEPGTRAMVVEFGDLQCPVCAEYSEVLIPQLIAGPVRRGEAKLEFRNFLIIGPESADAGAAAIAAGEQGRGWNFVELFYRNQGAENSGYVTDSFLESVARAAGVSDIAEWDAARRSNQVRREMERTTRQASRLGLGGTPSFVVEGPGGTDVLGTPGLSLEPFEQAIARAG